MGDLVLKGSTSGQITVTPTAVAGTNTLTLPAKTGNIITSADSGTVTQTMLSTGAPYWNSSGNIGIGTSSPIGPLDVTTASNAYGIFLRGRSSDNVSTIYVGSNNGASEYGYFSGRSTDFRLYTTTTIPLLLGINGAEQARIDTGGRLLVNYTTSNGSYPLQVNGQIFATSATIATSDARYKENVSPITDGLTLVNALNPVSFDWKQHPVHEFDLENTQVGFLAQEVQTAIADKPYLNSIIKANECELPDGTKEVFLGIAEGNMIAILTSAIKELSTKLDAAIAEIETLKGIN